MKVLSTDGLTKLIELNKNSFISVDDTVNTNTVTLATVATSGNYNDLTNKPTIQGNGIVDATTTNNSVIITTKNFVFEQAVASDTWVIVHNLGKKPSVILTDSAGTTFEADVEHDSDDQCTIHINGATTGTAYLN